MSVWNPSFMIGPSSAICSVVDRDRYSSVMRRLLAEPDIEVVKKLKANPGQMFAIAAGPVDERHKYAQTAYRIREGERAAFRPAGSFYATVEVNMEWEDPAELRAKFVPTSPVSDT